MNDFTCTRCGARFTAERVARDFAGMCPNCLVDFSSGTVAADSEPPPSIPGIEIVGRIGRGGMGTVYRARQTRLGRDVAVKVLPDVLAEDPEFVERFNREARALASLSHPNIVAVHEFGEAGGRHYIVMEFVDGTNLRDVIRSRRMTPREAIAIVPQLCDALEYAHDAGVVHRDIKPENILLDKKGRVKIADFGIAKIVGREPQRLTESLQVIGTMHYMAPEQYENPRQVDHRADIYSMGVVFYEMLTGELPIGRFAPPSSRVEVDVRLDQIVLRTLEKEPARRYQHASEVRDEISRVDAEVARAPLWVSVLLWVLLGWGLLTTMVFLDIFFRETDMPSLPMLLVMAAIGSLAGWIVWPILAGRRPQKAAGLVLSIGAVVLAAGYLFAVAQGIRNLPYPPAAVFVTLGGALALSVLLLRRASGRTRRLTLAAAMASSIGALIVAVVGATHLVLALQTVGGGRVQTIDVGPGPSITELERWRLERIEAAAALGALRRTRTDDHPAVTRTVEKLLHAERVLAAAEGRVPIARLEDFPAPLRERFGGPLVPADNEVVTVNPPPVRPPSPDIERPYAEQRDAVRERVALLEAAVAAGTATSAELAEARYELDVMDLKRGDLGVDDFSRRADAHFNKIIEDAETRHEAGLLSASDLIAARERTLRLRIEARDLMTARGWRPMTLQSLSFAPEDAPAGWSMADRWESMKLPLIARTDQEKAMLLYGFSQLVEIGPDDVAGGAIYAFTDGGGDGMYFVLVEIPDLALFDDLAAKLEGGAGRGGAVRMSVVRNAPFLGVGYLHQDAPEAFDALATKMRGRFRVDR